jgi:hypothetical protein
MLWQSAYTWNPYIHMFDELGLEVYETIGSMPVETTEEAPTRDNRLTEAILNLRAIEEQLRRITYGIHELMEGELWVTDHTGMDGGSGRATGKFTIVGNFRKL